MTLSTQQFNYLTEMGISLWQSKSVNTVEVANTESNFLKIDFNKICKSAFFRDILQALNLTIAEISADEHSIDLGLFTWRFCKNAEQQTPLCDFNQQTLITTPLEQLAQSSAAKKALWNLLINKALL